jgi:spermidine/putrescine transport system ATP-binding protein
MSQARLGPGPALNGRKPVLELRNVLKKFSGGGAAVRNISFDVYDGEFVFLIGPSGCGKTTTLRMIGGYETPSSGEIRVRGKLMNNVPLDERNIGMVFQSYALFPHMTVFENVEYGLRMRKVPKNDRRDRVMSVLQLVDLEAYGDRYPVQLSGGQRQRVALARVIVLEPDILLLDEPLANLDRRLRDIMRLELKKLQEKVGITTLYVTHDQEEALTMADRIVVMHDGDMLQMGTPADVYNCPRTPFVSKFLGETSHFDGVIKNVDQDTVTVSIADGLTIKIPHSNCCSENERVCVSIRPERVSIAQQKPAQAINVWHGKIDFVSYYGSHVIYLVRLDDGHSLLRASEPIPAGAATFAQGDSVYATWDLNQCVCVKA